MKYLILALSLCAAFLAPNPAEAGCRCGRSYISELYTCHKCPCECPSCDYRDCAVPEANLAHNFTPANYTPLAGPKTITIQDPVLFNVKSKVFHKESCQSARRCTANCAWTERADALKSGGRPCSKCGG